MTDEHQLLLAAIRHHEAGRLREADGLYAGVVHINWRNTEALHRRALVKQALGEHSEALQLLDKVVHFNPKSPAAYCHRAYTLQDLGRPREAIASLKRAIQLKPDFVDAHICLGALHAELGQVPAACAAFDRAIVLDPRAVDARLNKGLLLEKQGKLDDALVTFESALRIEPADPRLLHRKVSCLRQRGDLATALRLCESVLATYGQFAPLIFEHGLLLSARGEHAAAIVAFERASMLRHSADFCAYNIGECLSKLGRLAEAEAAFRQAIALRPTYFDALNGLGLVLCRLRRPAEALIALDRALAIKSDDINTVATRAEALLLLDRPTEATIALDHACAAHPRSAEVLRSLGAVLQRQGRFDEAMARYRQALALDPRHVQSMAEMANALRVSGRYAEALEFCDRATEIMPDYADAHMTAAMCRLEMGDYELGWKLYEWRWKTSLMALNRWSYPVPLWLGNSDISGKTLLIWADEGIGDTIQFVRYVPTVAACGGRVVLEVQPRLVPLLRRLPGIAEVFARGEAVPIPDLHCPVMSLPLACKATSSTIPSAPYLRADDEKIAAWCARVAGLPGLKVGLVWAGNPDAVIDHSRSMKLAWLAPLSEVEGVALVSLQMGDAAGEAANPPHGMTLHDWTSELHDSDDTAALITALDLVISVDTAVVHMAGALGKPVWLLNRFDSGWRWLRDSDGSPWYPSLRQFRQPRYGDWMGMVSSVRRALDHELAGRPRRGDH